MGLPAILLLFATGLQTVRQDQTPLRAGCDDTDTEVATLAAGQAVEVRFAVQGTCFAVTAESGGQPVRGFLAASALSGIDEFDRQRRQARDVDIPRLLSRAATASRAAGNAAEDSNPVERAVRLLESNQPMQALELLDRMIPRFPKEPDLFTLAGIAAQRADRTRDSVRYFRASLELKDDPEVVRLLRKAESELASDRSRHQIQEGRFLLRYDNRVVAPETARSIAAVLEQEYSRIAAVIGCRAEERLAVIVQSPEDYARSTDAVEWSGGMYDGRIHMPLPETRDVSPALRAALAHELVHACLHSTGPWPAWLHEGLAQKLSGEQSSAVMRQQLRALLRAGQLPRLSRMSQTWSRMSAAHARLAYAYALVAVELFLERLPDWGVANLVRNPQMLDPISEQLEQFLRQ